MLKNADFSFEKIQEKRKKYGNEMKNFSVSHGKNSRFFRRRKEKCRKERGKETEKFIESSEKGMKNIRPIGINSVINGRSGLQKRIFPRKESKEKTKKRRSPDKKSRKA